MALFMAVVSAATCYAGTLGMSDTASDACCAEMGEHCGGHQESVHRPIQPMQDCCVAPAADVVSAAVHVGVPPSLDSVQLVTPPSFQPGAQQALARDVDASSSPPTYLLVSVFRI